MGNDDRTESGKNSIRRITIDMEIKINEKITLDIDDDVDVRCENDIKEGIDETGWITRELQHTRIIVRRNNK